MVHLFGTSSLSESEARIRYFLRFYFVSEVSIANIKIMDTVTKYLNHGFVFPRHRDIFRCGAIAVPPNNQKVSTLNLVVNPHVLFLCDIP